MSTTSLYCRLPVDWLNDPSLCWFEWQAFLGSGLAVAAGAGTIIFLWKQLAQFEGHQAKLLERRHRATRTTLPLALSGLCGVLQNMLLQLDRAKKAVKQNGYTDNFFLIPAPTEYIEELKAVVASTDDPTVIEPTAEIIREMQTLWARVQVLNSRERQQRRAGLENNINEWMMQTAETHALVESLFPYARAETDEGPTEVSVERAESIIFQLGLEDKGLSDKIKSMLETSENFWSLK